MKDQFPLTPAALDSAWLSRVLDEDVGAITLERIGADRGNLGEIYRIDMARGPTPLVAKFGSPRDEDRAAAKRSGLFEREVAFYERLAPRLTMQLPSCHGAFYDEDSGQCLLLLEHVASAETLDLTAGIGLDRTRQVLEALAALHRDGQALLDATWLQDMRFEGRIRNLRLMVERGWPRLMSLCPDLVDPAVGDELPDRLEAMMHRMADLPTTVVHGDVKPDNMQATSGGIVLIDWQAVSFGPPAWDVAHAMVTCLTTEDRRTHEATLLAEYPHDLEGYEQALLFALVVAAALTVLGDPDEPRRAVVVRTMAERAVAALRDHDQL